MKKRVSRMNPNDVNSAMEANERGLLEASSVIEADTVNGVFTVFHDLGAVPDDVVVCLTSNVAVWATANDRLTWTASSVSLTGSATGTARLYAVRRRI